MIKRFHDGARETFLVTNVREELLDLASAYLRRPWNGRIIYYDRQGGIDFLVEVDSARRIVLSQSATNRGWGPSRPIEPEALRGILEQEFDRHPVWKPIANEPGIEIVRRPAAKEAPRGQLKLF